MLFNSIAFLVFFPLVVAITFSLSRRLRPAFLLAASYYFYCFWRPEYALLILASTLVDYYCALAMRGAAAGRRRALLGLSLAVNLGLLFTFKYLSFFVDSFNAAGGRLGFQAQLPALDLLLPVGISFYTFQTLSYTIDVYRGHREPEKRLLSFALYVAFFPQLVAGPIERSTYFLPQLSRPKSFDKRRAGQGLQLMLWGFFKKLVIADRLAAYVNPVYGNIDGHSGAQLALATYLFAFQIYCDFSGYSDIAIGGAQVLGYDLRLNFRRPYLARNIADFWSRWHISLSSWFRDYLYIPLGGNRVPLWRWRFNIFLVFLISGLWHGASWTFVAWGGLHGLYTIIDHWRPARSHPAARSSRWRQVFSILLTFHLVTLSWIFFRAPSIAEAWTILIKIFDFRGFSFAALDIQGLSFLQVGIGILAVVFLLAVEIWVGDDFRPTLRSWPRPLRICFHLVVLLLILNLGMFHAPQEFIYFQF